MANTLTDLMGTIYKALDVVSRELVGFIPAVTVDFDTAERAAVNQDVKFLAASEVSAGDTTPSTALNPADITEAPTTIKITKSRSAAFALTGEELKGLENSGSRQMLVQGKFEQAIRTLVNEMESDLFTAAKTAASRACGTAGTTPFATAADMSDLANLALILDDNGAPTTDRHIVLNNTAMASLRAKQGNLFNSGPELLRRGILTELEGFYIHQSGKIVQHTKGTGASYVTSGASAVGTEDIVLVTGTGTVLAGDIVTFAADTANKYVVNTGVTAPGTISIGKPGARIVIPTANAMTIGNSYTGNFGFHRGAVWFAVRPAAVPDGGDAAADAFFIIDPVSGLPFEVRIYPQYRRNVYEIAAAWGAAAVKSEHIATLLG